MKLEEEGRQTGSIGRDDMIINQRLILALELKGTRVFEPHQLYLKPSEIRPAAKSHSPCTYRIPSFFRTPVWKMLDLSDFVADRGGQPNKIKESQRKRSAPESDVDEVIALYEDARRGTGPNVC